MGYNIDETKWVGTDKIQIQEQYIQSKDKIWAKGEYNKFYNGLDKKEKSKMGKESQYGKQGWVFDQLFVKNPSVKYGKNVDMV